MALPKYPTASEYINEVNKCCDFAFRFARLTNPSVFFGTDFARRRNNGGVSVYKDVYAGTVVSIQDNAKQARDYARKTAKMARLYRKTAKLDYADKAIDYALYCADIAGYVCAQNKGCKTDIEDDVFKIAN